MKKKIIISITFCLIIFIGIISFILWDNRTVATIILDINPSIKINLNKNKKVKSIIALNDDAKNIINSSLKGKTLDDALNIITNSLVDKGYIEEGNVEIILYSNGNIKNDEIESKIKNSFGQKQIDVDVIVIENVTKEDEELAKKYNISPAKISYIKTITGENKKISVEKLVDKSVNELEETKRTGKYCDEGYTLEGDWCYKEKNTILASNGEVCPSGYLDYEGICYEEVGVLEKDNLLCREDFELDNNKCVRERSEDAVPSKYSCSNGVARTRADAGLSGINDGDANDIVCVDTSNATHPMSPCEVNDGTEYTIAGGTCYWHRAPIIEAGCPGKIQVNGFCWDDASNVLICVGARDGKQYSSRDEFCDESIIYSNPIIEQYKCESKNAKLKDDKCIFKEIEEAEKERYCSDGYTLVNNDRCINYNKTALKENGFVCEGENTRLKGNKCVIYEKIESKKY